MPSAPKRITPPLWLARSGCSSSPWFDGIGAAFYGEVPIERGRATSRNFGDYRLIRMREAPLAIETHFIASTRRPTGFGEPPLPPIAPAVANAIAALTGERIRLMPFIKAGYVLS